MKSASHYQNFRSLLRNCRHVIFLINKDCQLNSGLVLLILAILIKLVIGTDFCQIEREKCGGRPHIGCWNNFAVQASRRRLALLSLVFRYY